MANTDTVTLYTRLDSLKASNAFTDHNLFNAYFNFWRSKTVEINTRKHGQKFTEVWNNVSILFGNFYKNLTHFFNRSPVGLAFWTSSTTTIS